MGTINFMAIKTEPSHWVYTDVWTHFQERSCFYFFCYSNSDPNVLGKKYLQYLFQTKILPRHIRVDKGAETGKLCTMHTYLADKLGLFMVHQQQTKLSDGDEIYTIVLKNISKSTF